MKFYTYQYGHNVLYNSTRYQNVILSLISVDGFNDSQKIKMCAGHGMKIQFWNVQAVLSRLQLLYCAVHRDFQSISFFGLLFPRTDYVEPNDQCRLSKVFLLHQAVCVVK